MLSAIPNFTIDKGCFLPKIWCNYYFNVTPSEIFENHYLEGIVCEVLENGQFRELCGKAYSPPFCKGLIETHKIYFNQIIQDDLSLNSDFKSDYENACKKYIFKIREIYKDPDDDCKIIKSDYFQSEQVTVLNFANPDYDEEFFKQYCPTTSIVSGNNLGSYLNNVTQGQTYCNTTPVELCVFVPESLIGQTAIISLVPDNQTLPFTTNTTVKSCVFCFEASPANTLINSSFTGSVKVSLRIGSTQEFFAESIELKFKCCKERKLFCYLNAQGVYDYIESTPIKEIGITTENKYKCIAKSSDFKGRQISIGKDLNKTYTVYFEKELYSEDQVECLFSSAKIFCGEINERTGELCWYAVSPESNEFSIFKAANQNNHEFIFSIENAKPVLVN